MLRHLILLPVWAAGAWLLHRELDRVAPNRDPYLLPIAMLLTGWGILVIWRLNPAFGMRQTLWLGLACLLMLGVYRLNPRLNWLRDYRYLWMALALALLGLTLVFGSNPLGGEPKLWLGCCGVYFQPSEPLRFFLVAFLASYLADRLRLNGASTTRLAWRDFFPLLLVWGISVILLVVQRDLGTGMIFLALLALLLYLATGAWQVLVMSAVVAVGGGVLSYFLFDVVQVRVQGWLNPWLDPSGASYQIVQSLISIASGGIVGRGPGLGSPGFVPASHTDFIFTAITEEFGLVGAVAVLALFAVFVSRGLKIGLNHPDIFSRFLSAGLTIAIGMQAIFIIAGVMRALPLVGVTLPFISYGGSSLLTSFAALAILLLLSNSEGVVRSRLYSIEAVQIGFSVTWSMLALIAAWWTIYRAPMLVARTDNPRRALDTRFVERGMITDRNGVVLAHSIGSPGAYDREYLYPETAPVTGFDSMIYGQAGIEKTMDPVLRGLERGTVFGNAWHRLVTGHPPEGENISLTIDIQLQSLAMDLLADSSGAGVLLEAHSGELYAIASQPSYNPNQIEESWSSLLANEDAPLFNRAAQALYQPGLSMVPFLFAHANAEGKIEAGERTTNLANPVRVDGDLLSCTRQPPDSNENTLEAALRYGCPELLQKELVKLGWDSIRNAIDIFGFTTPAGIRLASVGSINLPNNPSMAELEQLVIGQGTLRVSPLQMARAVGGLFADVERAPLQLVRAIDVDDEGWNLLQPEGYRVPALSANVIESLKHIYAFTGTASYEWLAPALTGTEDHQLGWYIGVEEDGDALWVVVVVLEDEKPYKAAGIGREILSAAGEFNP
jgi:cell division protein FtsW (lipid II flippase)